MRQLVCNRPASEIANAELVVEEVSIPVPRNGEVLIKVAASPVNPSDYGEWKKELEEGAEWKSVRCGKEGSGAVVASGGGVWANSMVGAKVGFANLTGGQGAYSEYVTAGFSSTFSLPAALPVEACCSFFVNPFTAFGILDTARTRCGARGFIHTGAASQLGQMLVKLCSPPAAGNPNHMTLINVVRREEQAELLRSLGAAHVVVTGSRPEAEWRKELKALAKELKVSVAFDCVAGSMTEALVDAVPKGGTVFVYGRLSNEAARVQPTDLIYFGKKLEGFLLGGRGHSCWLRLDGAGNMVRTLGKLNAAGKAVMPALGQGGWAESRFVDCSLEEMQGRISALLTEGATNKKLRIRFGDTNPVIETPVPETPVPEIPVPETPVAESLVAESPVAESPASELPVSESPVS